MLDMSNEHVPEINQTLWIKGEKLLRDWPNLPEQPDAYWASFANISALHLAISASSRVIRQEDTAAAYATCNTQKQSPSSPN